MRRGRTWFTDTATVCQKYCVNVKSRHFFDLSTTTLNQKALRRGRQSDKLAVWPRRGGGTHPATADNTDASTTTHPAFDVKFKGVQDMAPRSDTAVPPDPSNKLSTSSMMPNDK